jgi:putative membrane protein
MDVKKRADWILRFVKGIFIGSGFILPGVSGGALAAVFGIYERIISFLSNITKDFKKNVLFFIPVGLGACVGIFALSFPVKFLLSHAPVFTMWFFIGCIVGMAPSLVKQSGKQGHKPIHIALMLIVTAVMFTVLYYLRTLFPESDMESSTLPAILPTSQIYTWAIAGALIGLGVIVPGLSPSNFLLYMGLYYPMSAGIGDLDLRVILPLAVGAAACVVFLSKIMNYIFSKAYAVLYHCILGIVLASTLVIVPFTYNYLSWGGLVCLGTCLAGAALAFGMSKLDDKYKPEN